MGHYHHLISWKAASRVPMTPRWPPPGTCFHCGAKWVSGQIRRGVSTENDVAISVWIHNACTEEAQARYLADVRDKVKRREAAEAVDVVTLEATVKAIATWLESDDAGKIMAGHEWSIRGRGALADAIRLKWMPAR